MQNAINLIYIQTRSKCTFNPLYLCWHVPVLLFVFLLLVNYLFLQGSPHLFFVFLSILQSFKTSLFAFSFFVNRPTPFLQGSRHLFFLFLSTGVLHSFKATFISSSVNTLFLQGSPQQQLLFRRQLAIPCKHNRRWLQDVIIDPYTYVLGLGFLAYVSMYI